MKYRFKVPIGDWSDDGHGKCETFTVEANHPVEELQQAYKDSCKLTGVSFNHNEDYTELNLGYGSSRQIATEYESYTIPHTAAELLLQHGIDVWEGFDRDAFDETDEAPIDGTDYFLDLLMKFISLSISDLEYKVINEELPYLNGYWNKNLNVQFGYGLFN